jgi:hypothetical protein
MPKFIPTPIPQVFHCVPVTVVAFVFCSACATAGETPVNEKKPFDSPTEAQSVVMKDESGPSTGIGIGGIGGPSVSRPPFDPKTRNASSLRDCDEYARTQAPPLSGNISLELNFLTDGESSTRPVSVLHDSVGDDLLRRCIVGVAYNHVVSVKRAAKRQGIRIISPPMLAQITIPSGTYAFPRPPEAPPPPVLRKST